MERANVVNSGRNVEGAISTERQRARICEPLREKEISKIIATPTPPPPCSDLPSYPSVPFLLHPHRPLLLWCSSSAVHAYDFANNRWEAGGPQQLQPRLQQLHQLPIAATDCICLQCGARSSSLRDSTTLSKKHTFFRGLYSHTHTWPTPETAAIVTVPGDKRNRRRGCAADSGEFLAQHAASNDTAAPLVRDNSPDGNGCSATSTSPAEPNVAGGASSGCVWVTAGEDKYLNFVEIGSYKLVRSRLQRKKLSAAVFLGCSSVSIAAPSSPSKEVRTAKFSKDDSLQQNEAVSTSCSSSAAVQREEQRQRPALQLLLADKFGDVYLLGDSLGAPPEQALAGDLLSESMRTLPSVHGVRVAAAAAAGVFPLSDGSSGISDRFAVAATSGVSSAAASAGGSVAGKPTATADGRPTQPAEKATASTRPSGAAAKTNIPLEQQSELAGEQVGDVSICGANITSHEEGGRVSSPLLRGRKRDKNQRSMDNSTASTSMEGEARGNKLQSHPAVSVLPAVNSAADASDNAPSTTGGETASEAGVFAAPLQTASPIRPCTVDAAAAHQGARGCTTCRPQLGEGEVITPASGTDRTSVRYVQHQSECLERRMQQTQHESKEEQTPEQLGDEEGDASHTREQRFRENEWQRERARLWRQRHLQTTLTRTRQQQQIEVGMHVTTHAGMHDKDEKNHEEGSMENGPMDIPLLSHLTTITVMKVFRGTAPCPRTLLISEASLPPMPQPHLSSSKEGGADLLLTADRDEKIRVCLLDQPWSIESFYLGHSEFVTDFVVIADGLSRRQAELRDVCVDCNKSSSGEEVADAKGMRRCALAQSCWGIDNCSSIREMVSATDDRSDAGEATTTCPSKSDSDIHLPPREKAFLQKTGISASADGTLQAWRVRDGAQLDVLPLIPENLFHNDRGDLSHVLSSYEGVTPEAKHAPPGVPHPPLSREQLLPTSLLFDEDQRLLLVQCFKLRGLLLISVEQEETIVSESWVVSPRSPRLGRQPFFIPFPMVPAAILLVYHSFEELTQTPALAQAAQVLRPLLSAASIVEGWNNRQSKQKPNPSCATDITARGAPPSEEHHSRFTPTERKEGSVLLTAAASIPFVWWIDEMGRLRPPICTSLTLLRRVQDGHLQEDSRRDEASSGKPFSHAFSGAQILPCVEGCSFDELGTDYGATAARANSVYYWKRTRSSTCPTQTERAARRLRHKHLQQQQQQLSPWSNGSEEDG